LRSDPEPGSPGQLEPADQIVGGVHNEVAIRTVRRWLAGVGHGQYPVDPEGPAACRADRGRGATARNSSTSA
jgi:hypothetical protein